MNQNQQPLTWASWSVDDYVRERVDDQLAWYSKKSAANKNWYFRLQLFTLVAAASIPVITLSSSDNAVRTVVAVIGALTAIAAGAVTLFQFRDQWIDYRSTAEALKCEKYLFLTGSAPYTDDNAFSMFTNRVEFIILQENQGWQDKNFNPESANDSADTRHQSPDKEELT